MDYGFDRIIERKNTGCVKYDSRPPDKAPDALPMWVADMDFESPKCVIEALEQRVEHGVFGYSLPTADYFAALEYWFGTRYGYKFEKEWVVMTPGIIFAVSMAIRAYTQPGDAIIIQEPLYPPIKQSILRNDRKAVINHLKLEDGIYRTDFIEFENQIRNNNVKMFILCSPHNPGMRVWSKDELRMFADICKAHDVLIIADEVWCDVTFAGHKHHSLPVIAPDYQHRMVLLTSGSKTFNLAALKLANVFIADDTLRKAFFGELGKCGLGSPNALPMAALRAAYSEEGAHWLGAALEYISANIEYMDNYLKQHLPKVKLIKPEGTYVVWVDFRGLNLPPDELDKLICFDAKLWFNRGETFGEAGAGFHRINAACPREVVVECMNRLAATLGKHI